MTSHFLLMAEYNEWMNQSLYAVASGLSHEALSKDRGCFFGSILGTLNHIVVADIIWLKRFATHPQGFPVLESVSAAPLPPQLDAILHADFEALRQQRVALDHIIVDFVDQLSDDVLASYLSYHNTQGVSCTKCFAHLMQHFFNHQTHHRGQITTLLSQCGLDVGVTDLLVKIPNV